MAPQTSLPKEGPAPKAATAGAKPAGEEEIEYHGLGALEELVQQYHVPYGKEALMGMADDQYRVHPNHLKAFEEHLSNVSQGLFPTLAKQIKAGIKPAHLLEPYRQVAKSVMQDQNLEPDFIADPKWAHALHGGTHPETGAPTPMPLHDWKTKLQSDPQYGYAGTPMGKESLETLAKSFNQIAGK